ncbi:zinc ribbon domain-containing protein [Caproiciproducens sp. CPB-2]|uniref:zinc ribbon domain-containing protein n=1 Tax=Caproiciproducens sp. CPB-2 TaxID=3030017 RepID=UPI0023D9ECF3|nr:zinc ribbon domain-containing protein [Caproiciproducens sp. CPB-2]MDF1493984.1 zinc ribbon domain-containing protein [Caproiciproducens sp. CPB-2]
MMIFKTLMLQLYKPGKQKRDLMDTALLRYSRALQFLMDTYRNEITELSKSEKDITQHQILKMIDRETAKSLNRFDIQPFKDSLLMEFSAIAASYLARRRNHPKTGYPLPFLDAPRYSRAMSDCVAQFDSGKIGPQRFQHRSFKLVDKAGKLRSVYFGRYAMNRDYCLLYDEFKERFYAKLYLMNRADSVPGGYCASGLSLKYVWDGMPFINNLPGQRRYIVVPLAFGKEQYADLKEALKNPRLLHSSRLVKKDRQYYLMVNIECSRQITRETVTTMGVARGVHGGLSYTICDKGGVVRERKRISACQKQNDPSAFSNTIAEIAAKNRSQVVLEANGGKNDRMPVPAQNPELCFSVGDYLLLAQKLKYKLPGKGLPPPVEVSSNGLFLTCPRCGTRTQRNRVTDELFACIRCGYAAEFETVGSENLAKRLDKYHSDKVPITVSKKEDGFLCCNKILGFRCELPPDTTDYTPMFEELDRFIGRMRETYIDDSKRYAVWKKLAQAPDLRKSVHLLLR